LSGSTQSSINNVLGQLHPNNSPVLKLIGNKAVQVGQPLSFSVYATDNDTPLAQLKFSAAGLPPGATFASGTFAWTAIAPVVNYSVAFTVKVSRRWLI